MEDIVGGGRGFEGKAKRPWCAKAVESADENVDVSHACRSDYRSRYPVDRPRAVGQKLKIEESG